MAPWLDPSLINPVAQIQQLSDSSLLCGGYRSYMVYWKVDPLLRYFNAGVIFNVCVSSDSIDHCHLICWIQFLLILKSEGRMMGYMTRCTG
jgi:hypothetical protein